MNESRKNGAKPHGSPRGALGTLGRRALFGAAGGLATAGAFRLAAPAVHAQEPVTLRYLGTAVNQSAEIAAKVKQDLGITIEYIPVVTDDVIRRAVTQPNTFDLLDMEYFSAKRVAPSGNLQGIEAKRIKEFDNITPVFTKGEIDGRKIGEQGTAPKKVQFMKGRNSKEFADGPTEWMSLIPTTYNADTLGIRPDLVGKPITQWKDLLDPAFKGKASILNIPSIGIMDAAMVAESMGEMKYGDKGNMTKAEIDKTVALLIEAKKAGQFRAFWKTFDESVNLMASGEVVIQSMWSPAVAAVRAKGIPCTYQPLKEGYRAWGGGLGIAKHVSGLELEAAYEYINWYLSGWVGAYLNRQGYYSAVLDTAKEHMSAEEWAFWMEGKPAATDILSPEGKVMEKAGAVRDGGSFYDRMGAVACWNAVMDEDRYMLRKWNEFIAA